MISANPEVSRWGGKYQTSFENSKSEAAPTAPAGESELVRYSTQLGGRGAALELASGKGANALYLASLGYNVVAADCAFNGLTQGQRSANHLQLPMASLVCDLQRQPFPVGYFSLISVVRFLERSIFPQIQSWIQPGGLLFYKTFNKKHLERQPGFNPAYLVECGELNNAFSDLTILESDINTRVHQKGSSSYIIAQKRAK